MCSCLTSCQSGTLRMSGTCPCIQRRSYEVGLLDAARTVFKCAVIWALATARHKSRARADGPLTNERFTLEELAGTLAHAAAPTGVEAELPGNSHEPDFGDAARAGSRPVQSFCSASNRINKVERNDSHALLLRAFPEKQLRSGLRACLGTSPSSASGAAPCRSTSIVRATSVQSRHRSGDRSLSSSMWATSRRPGRSECSSNTSDGARRRGLSTPARRQDQRTRRHHTQRLAGVSEI